MRGAKPHHNGFEARRCEEGQRDDDDDDEACARPPFFAAMETKSVIGGGRSSKLPKWFAQWQTVASPEPPSSARAVEVRRFDLRTGALVMPWTRYASQSAAARELSQRHGLSNGIISKLVRGAKPHHNGFEARRCEEGQRDDDDDDEACAQPPFFAAMETKSVIGGGRSSKLPKWFAQWQTVASPEPPSSARAVEVRRFDLRTGALVMPWTRYASQSAAARELSKQHGLSDGIISKLVRGAKLHHNGFEVRRCDRENDGGSGCGSEEHEEHDDDTEVNDDAPPSWFRRQRQLGILGRTTSHYRSIAVEVRSPSRAMERSAVEMTWYIRIWSLNNWRVTVK